MKRLRTLRRWFKRRFDYAPLACLVLLALFAALRIADPALAGGINSLSVSNVEHLASSDYTGAAVNDTLTLLNDVSGMTVDLAQGDNVLNLAAGRRRRVTAKTW